MRFIDEIKITVAGGDGGDGLLHWRREKFRPRAGPDGGDGGNGGAVIFLADTGVSTLLEFSFVPVHRAENGSPGGDNNRTGADGSDLILKVPVGTQVFFNDELVADLPQPGARWVAARGGRGGKGNTFFTTSSNQSPEFAQPGQPGEQFSFRLVLKSVADVGLVGFPNVGKSTLISAISSAKPKIANYEFTTITPNLGVVQVGERRYVVADIPGLIPDAHQGKGLGVRFLKHIERTRGICFVLDVLRDPSVSYLENGRAQYEALEKELLAFSSELSRLARLVCITKADLGLDDEGLSELESYFAGKHLKMLTVSGVSGAGTEELKVALLELS
jgi:GTP-binding protein